MIWLKLHDMRVLYSRSHASSPLQINDGAAVRNIGHLYCTNSAQQMRNHLLVPQQGLRRMTSTPTSNSARHGIDKGTTMRSHSFPAFDHAPSTDLPSLQLLRQRVGSATRRALDTTVATVFTVAAAAVLTVLAVLLKR